MKASLKPGYLKVNIAATAVGKEERKMLLITICWMKASNALDDGHLMPSNPLFKRHWRFVLNLILKIQKGGPLGIPRATTPGPAEEGQPRDVPGPVGKSYETPTITFHHAQYTSKSTPSLCTFPSEGRPARPNSRQLFESHPNATPTSWAFPARNAFFWTSLRHH